MPTKRIFDLVIITGLALHLATGGLVRPWARRWAKETTGVQQLAGEAIVRAI